MRIEKLRVPDSEFQDLSLEVSTKVIDQTEWNNFSGHSIYTKNHFLDLLERQGPQEYSYYYIIIKDGLETIGSMYCQSKVIDLSRDYRIHSHSEKWLEKLKVSILKNAFKFVKHRMLICGNVILTGEYGFCNLPDKYPVSLIAKILSALKQLIEKEENSKIRSIFLKDYYEDQLFSTATFESEDYTKFQVQPDMILTLDPAWQNYQDYLAVVKSKYRVKFKKVKKKGKDLVFKELDIDLVSRYNDEMYALYKATADRATFSMFLLDRNYFGQLKQTLKDDIILTGVFLDDTLVAFYTYVKNGEFGDAHFLGYDVKLNSKYQIYFNLLLKLVELAIINKAKYLNLSRTALEIKSSVGAKAYNMSVYLKHSRPWINKLLPKILARTVPKEQWIAREPFK